VRHPALGRAIPHPPRPGAEAGDSQLFDRVLRNAHESVSISRTDFAFQEGFSIDSRSLTIPSDNHTPLPMDPTFQSIVASFRSRLTKAELDEFKFCSLKDVQQTIVDIQARQDKRRETRNLSRIRGFLEAMTQFGTVVEVFLNTSEILAFVWGPLKFLLLV
jgi:hypothetical protein